MFVQRLAKAYLRNAGYSVTRPACASPNQSPPPFGHDPFSDVIQLAGTQSIKTIFDVGANVGTMTSMFAKTFPESSIYSFEPYSDTFGQLRAATQTLNNVSSFNIALGHQDGDATLFLNKDSATNSLFKNSDDLARFADYSEGVIPTGSVPVNVRRLDTFCDENEVHAIDVMKIDTQGYELKVLEGAGQLLDYQRIRFIYLEVLFVSLYEQQAEFYDVYRELTRHAYKFVGLYNSVRDKGGFLKWCDALFMVESK